MAYKWNDKGLIVGDGLPDGLQVDLKQFQNRLNQFEAERASGNALYPSANAKSKLSGSISNFVYKNGKLQGFIPQIDYEPTSVNRYTGQQEIQGASNDPFIRSGAVSQPDKGYYVDVGGIAFDEATKSGDIPDGADVTFSTDQGSTLATFKNGNQVAGYMRLATQQAKQADSLRLGNQSGTLSGSVRQNAQRRTIL